ncbi:aminotransferase [Siphonobacter sp. SORGH_AS_0500]|uniref:aminotransferase n=1 Tax=Siphonobacter sp. SORGH_AS_0500 TaxID=1864824 RepID=UPI000CBCF885|nr:aminotransferase [Siphonobacter sp. SORGH_AS_0500]MDR6196241.1 hypothetical protein [Siphonobacter sp. SORGH_AS_0500]PKK38146.1 hypothetical protein BWI96_03450 [Siphonobacter sp. SORGH_AS_0500]
MKTTYQIKSSNAGFEIYNEHEKLLTTFRYDGWFSSNGKAELPDKQLFLKPKNIWASKFDIFINEIDKGDIVFNWKGQIIIRIDYDGKEKIFLLKGRGLMNHHFILENEMGIVTLAFMPRFNWTSFRYEYQVEVEPNQESPLELLISCQFAINLYMTMTTAAAV